MTQKRPPGEHAGRVAVILALGMAIALNVVTIALLYAAIIRLGLNPDDPSKSGLSDNGVQVLLAWGGGIISVLAGYVGYVVGKKDGKAEKASESDDPVEPPPTEQK